MINLTVVIDNDEAVKKLRELQNVAKTTTSSVVKDSERMDASWQQMKNSLMSLTAGVSFAALAKQVVQVRGEVQQLEVAFETMLGSKQKADTLMTEIIDLAAKTPFGLQDVSNATKMLLAYGSTAEQVTDEIKMLGNIASGLSIPLNDMIYLYGTTRTQGRMFTQDLRQFMGRGIPLAEELAKQFGVTKDKVGELVTAGKVGFDEMAKALQAMTSEGGKFNNLMDKQSQTIAGQISNLEDAIYQMFNEIGQSSEGVISDMISGASWVVEHYQEILNVLKYVIAAYGSYRAALILVAGAQKALALAEATAGLLKMTSAARGLSIALKGLTAAAGPIGLIVSVLGIAVTAFTSYNRKTEEATEQMGKLEKAAYDEYIEVNRLVSRLHDANLSESERNSILNRLKTVAPDILKGISDEANMTAQLTANLKDYNDEQVRRIQLAGLNDRMEGELKKVGDAEIKKAEAELALNNLISDYNARRRTLWIPSLQYSTELKGSGVRYSPSDKQREEIEAEITKALDDILGDVHTTDAYKALKIEDYLSKTHSIGGLQYNVSGIEGFDIKNVIAKVDNANKNLNEAKKAFDTYINEDKKLREILGVVSNKTEGSAGDALTYAEAYKAAQKNYIDTQKALADAEKNKSNYTEQQYKDIKDRADAAKKAYQELGGVTSTKAQTEQEKQAKEAAKLAKQLQYDADQATIDAMVEGTDKKVAQIELDYKKRKDAIQQQEADLMAKQGKPLTAEQNASFDKLHASNKMQATSEWEQYVEEQVEAAGAILRAEQEARKAEETVWNEYLIQYGNFQEKIKATTEKYASEIANAKSVGERKSLEAERDILLAEYEVQAEGYAKELVGKTTTQLNKMLEELTAQVKAKEDAFQALDSTTGDDAEKLRKEIAKLKAQIKELKAQTGEASDAISNENWADAINLFQNIGNSATEAAEGISEFDENLGFALKGIAQLASLSVEMIGALQGVQKAFEKTGEAASAMEKASAILAIISVVIKAVSGIVSGISNIMNSNYEATRNATLAAYEYAQALEKIANVELRESFRSMFGVDEFGKFSALLTETQKQLENIDKIKSDYIARVTTTPFFSTRDQKANAYVLLHNNMNPEVLYADMRSEWQRFWGTGKDNEIRANLSEFFEDGILNVDKLKAWYEQYGKYLSNAQSDLVESLIESGELYEENMAEINSYMQSIFGELGASITDSVVDAFRNGTDAAEAMGDAVSNVLERIATDMAHAAFIQPLLEQAQEGIEALNTQRSEGGLSDEEYMRELMAITSTLMGNAKNAGEDMSAYLQTMQQMADEMGIDLFESDSSKNSTHSKGFQTMSQETGSELNGRFTDIQGQTHRIAEAVEFCKSLHLENLSQVQSINATVAMIHNDTSLIAQHTKALATIDANLDALRRSVDNGII